MQMQLAPICIRQQLTDAQMADRQRCARHLWQRERLAAILSEAVPIWTETTTLHYCDDGSSLGAAGAHCTTLSRPSIYSLFIHTDRALCCGELTDAERLACIVQNAQICERFII